MTCPSYCAAQTATNMLHKLVIACAVVAALALPSAAGVATKANLAKAVALDDAALPLRHGNLKGGVRTSKSHTVLRLVCS